MTHATPIGRVAAPSVQLPQPQHAPSLDGAFALLLTLFADRPDSRPLEALAKERALNRQDDEAHASTPGRAESDSAHECAAAEDEAADSYPVADTEADHAPDDAVETDDDQIDDTQTVDAPATSATSTTDATIAAVPPQGTAAETNPVNAAPTDFAGSENVAPVAGSTDVVPSADDPAGAAQAPGKAIAAHGVQPVPPGSALGHDDPATLPLLPDQASARAHEVRPTAHPTKAESSGSDSASLLATVAGLATEPAAGEAQAKGLRATREAAPLVSRPTTMLATDALVLQEDMLAAPQPPSRVQGASTVGAIAAQLSDAAGAEQPTAAAATNGQTVADPALARVAATSGACAPQAAASTFVSKQPANTSALEAPTVSSVIRSNDLIQTAATPRAGAALKPRAIAQIALSIQHAAASGRDRLRLKLDPAELGRVEVRLEVTRDHHLKAQLLVERPETLELLQRDARQLQRALADAGLEADAQDLTFSLEDRGSAAFAQDHQPRPENGPASEGPLIAEAASALPPPAARLAPGRLDLHV